MPEDDKPSGGSSAPKPAVKAKLPSAQGIKRPDFTPHGINSGSKGRGPRPSALTAAQAKKRQRVMIAGVLVAVLVIAGGATWYLTRPGPKVEVSGAFLKEPKVKIPGDLKPHGKYKVTEKIVGKGPKITNGDLAFVHLTFYKWPEKKASKSAALMAAAADAPPEPTPSDKTKDGGKLGSTYKEGAPASIEVGKKDSQGIDKTLEKSLLGRTSGSRLIVEIPPADGFGKQGNEQLGVAPTDSMLFVLDVVAAYPKKAQLPPGGTEQKLDDKNLPKVEAGKPGEAPKVTLPKVNPPAKLEIKQLIQGTGPAVGNGQTAIVNYQGQIWKTGKVFDSSWQKGSIAPFPIKQGATVPGFYKGLLNQKVGSRVLLVLPPAEGYGKEGQPQAGIKGTDTLVFLVDIVGVVPN